MLGNFKCGRDEGIEDFLQRFAMPFEKSRRSCTYLVVDREGPDELGLNILGFFSLALTITRLEPDITKTLRKKLGGMFMDDDVPSYLVGQLAKNDLFPDEIEGDELLRSALSMLYDAQDLIGGRFVRVDCLDRPALVMFYLRSNFRMLRRDDELGMCQMVRLL